MRKPFFIVIRGSDDPTGSGVGQFIGAFEDQGAAEEEVILQSQYDPSTSGFYFIAEFEAQQAGALSALSGALQASINAIVASGIAYDDTALSGFLQSQIDQNRTDIIVASGELHAADLEASGYLQGQVDQNRSDLITASGELHAADLQSSGHLQWQIDQTRADLITASGELYNTTVQASGHLQNQVDENTAFIAAASGNLQGQVDLARFQLSFSFGGGTTPGFNSSSSEYELAGTFPYPGSDNIVNPPTQLICYASMNQANKDGAIRCYDVTNDQTIGEASFTGNTAIEQQTVPLSNLPGSGATMEIHVKRVTSGGAITLYSATIY